MLKAKAAPQKWQIRLEKIPEEHVFGISSYKINKHNHFGEMVFLTLIQTYHTV